MTERPGTGPLADKLAQMRKSITGKLVETSAKLDPSGSAAGLIAQGALAHLRGEAGVVEAPAPEPEAFGRDAVLDEARRKQEEAAAESRKRMAFIVTYVKDPSAKAIFQEREAVYKVLTDERAYQHELIQRLEAERAQLPPHPEAMGLTREQWQADPTLVAVEEGRATLEKRLKQAQAVQTQIFGLLKTLTGATGASGADFIAPPPDPTVTAETSSADALDATSALLKRLQGGK
jgi:hypothetical protein